MSNWLSVRRVRVQTIDDQGNPEGEPSYGVMAADDHEQSYDDTYRTLDELNAAIEKAGCILDVAGGFDTVSREGIGTGNFCGDVRNTLDLDEERDHG